MKRRCAGWGLVETLLTLGAVSALSLGIYLVLAPARANAQAKAEQDNLRDLSAAVERSWGVLGSFQSVSTDRVVADVLMPSRMFDGKTLRTGWGTSVSVLPHSLHAPADGFSVVYPLAPSAVCSRLGAATARNLHDLRIDGVSAFTGGLPDPGAIAGLCGQRDVVTMEFVYHSGLVAGSMVAAPPLALPPISPGVMPPTSAPVGAPVGPVGPVGPAAPVAPVTPAPGVPSVEAPPSVAPPATPVSPATPPPSVVPPSVSPPSTVAACSPPAASSEARTLTCPNGQVGMVTEQRTTTWACPEAWGAPQPSITAWTAVGSSCAPCPGPETRSRACPSGQLGSITDQRSFVCSGAGAWGSWGQIANSCTPACSAPASATEGRTLTCPNGQVGAITEQRTVSWTCPSASGSPVSNVSAWSVVSNTCAAVCSVPTPSTQTSTEIRTASQALACPAGQVGAITQERQEQRTQTRSASCPAPTGAFVWSAWSAWSGWSATTAWATVSSTCAASKVYQWKLVSHTGDQLIASGPCTTSGTNPSPIPVCSSATEGQTYTRTINRGTCAPVYMPGVSIDTYQCVGQ